MGASSAFPALAPATDAQARAQTASGVGVSPANMAARSAFAAHKNGTSQTGVTDNTLTKVTFGTEVLDRAGDFATSTWTPPAGAVFIYGSVRIDGTIAAGASCYCAIYKNGSIMAVSAPIAAVTANNSRVQVSAVDLANGTDYYEIYAVVDTSDSSTGTFHGDVTATRFFGFQL